MIPTFLILLVASVLGFPRVAAAYVDPGTTGSVFGVLTAIISGAGVALAFLARPISRLFRRRKKTSHDKPSGTTPQQTPPPA